ncbi:hypothetical protein F4861DRAFT_542780 [Xylaria intraflava]|nr:hypothetical protein F4861DRAFT_542780 [Xylaria intraflava]
MKQLVEQLDKHILHMKARKKALLHQLTSFAHVEKEQDNNLLNGMPLMDPLPLDMATWFPSKADDLLFAPEAMRGYDAELYNHLPDSGLSSFLGNPKFFTWQF